MGFFDTRVRDRGWEEVPMTDAQLKAQAGLFNIGKTAHDAPTRQIASATGTERDAFYGPESLLGRYAGSGAPETLSEAMKQSLNIARTPVDIMKIPGMDSVFELAKRAGDRYLNRTARTLKGTGNLRSSTGAGVLSRAAGEATAGIASTMAPYAESATERKFRNISLLGQLGESEEQTINNRLEAVQRFNLERSLIQQGYDATQAKQMADIQIKLQQEQMRLQALAAIFGREGFAFNQGISSPSMFSNLATGVSAGVSLFGGGGGGGTPDFYGGNMYS